MEWNNGRLCGDKFQLCDETVKTFVKRKKNQCIFPSMITGQRHLNSHITDEIDYERRQWICDPDISHYSKTSLTWKEAFGSALHSQWAHVGDPILEVSQYCPEMPWSNAFWTILKREEMCPQICSLHKTGEWKPSGIPCTFVDQLQGCEMCFSRICTGDENRDPEFLQKISLRLNRDVPS